MALYPPAGVWRPVQARKGETELTDQLTIAPHHRAITNPPASRKLIVAALGVVYGDIGTSPLYAFKQCFDGVGTVHEPRILGALSLITWALMIVVTFKYVLVVMRADNRGEGGILALTALALRPSSGSAARWVLFAGLLGASLFYGDGIITPAISLLGAVEGLKVATPVFDAYVLPITIVLLVVLFVAQRTGTARVGAFFGPVMVFWFVVSSAMHRPRSRSCATRRILVALNPIYGLSLLWMRTRPEASPSWDRSCWR